MSVCSSEDRILRAQLASIDTDELVATDAAGQELPVQLPASLGLRVRGKLARVDHARGAGSGVDVGCALGACLGAWRKQVDGKRKSSQRPGVPQHALKATREDRAPFAEVMEIFDG